MEPNQLDQILKLPSSALRLACSLNGGPDQDRNERHGRIGFLLTQSHYTTFHCCVTQAAKMAGYYSMGGLGAI